MPYLTLVPLVGAILAWRRLLGSTTASAALHAPAAVLLVVYLAALAGVLRPVVWLLLFAGIVLAIYEIARLAQDRQSLPLPVGMLLLLGFLFWILHRNGGFAYYDEYAHWGIYVKELLAHHALWGAESNAMHLRYVPGPPLWQYLFVATGGPLEGGAFLAQFCLLLMPLAIVWQGLAWRQAAWLAGIVLLLIAGFANFGHGFASLYVDHVLAAWFAGTLFNFAADLDRDDGRRVWSYALPVAAMVLLKDVGLYFALAATGIMAMLAFWKIGLAGSVRKTGTAARTAGVLVLAGFAAAALVTASWNLNREAMAVPAATVSLGGILAGLASGATTLDATDQAELWRRFVDVLTSHQISKDETSAMFNAFTYSTMPLFTERFRLTTASAVAIFALWQFLVLRAVVGNGNRWRWNILGAGMLATLLVYLVVLAFSYRFAFDDRALSLSSLVRYVHTALLPMFLLMFVPLLPGFASSGRKIGLPAGLVVPAPTALFALLLAATWAFETPYLKPVYRAHEAPPVYAQLEPLTARLAGTVGNGRLWVYFPVPDSNGLMGRIIRYQMTPVRTEVSVDPDLFESQPDIVQSLVADYDYLWFPIDNPDLESRLRFYFGENLKQRVFRVDRTGSTISVTALDGVF